MVTGRWSLRAIAIAFSLTTAIAPATAQAPGTIGLPVLKLVGPLPPPDETLALELRRDGSCAIGSETMAFKELLIRIRARSKTVAQPTDLIVPSNLNLVVHADAEVPFVAVARLVDGCGAPDIAVRRLFFAARTEGGQVGAFALFLPTEERPSPRAELAMHCRDTAVSPSSAQSFAQRSLKKDAQPESRALAFRVAPELPFGKVLEVLGWAASGGAEQATIWLDSTTNDWRAMEPTQLVVATVTPTQTPTLTSGSKRIANEPAPTTAGRVLPEFVGFTAAGVWVEGALGLHRPAVRQPPPIVDPKGPYGLRFQKRREDNVTRAIDAGLGWLAAHQDKDGRWDADGFMKHDTAEPKCDGAGQAARDVGITGLALLAMLSCGNTTEQGPHREAVKRGLDWLCLQQDKKGRFAGEEIYGNAIATFALVEGYGLSTNGVHREAAQRGLDYLEEHRNPYSVWRYRPRDNDNDSSVTGWCTNAIASARRLRLHIEPASLDFAKAWYDQVNDPATGSAGYSKAGEPSARQPGDHADRFPPQKGEAMTAVSLLARLQLGQDPKETPAMLRGADRIAEKPPVWDVKGGSIDFYYWYHAATVLPHIKNAKFAPWRKKLEDALLKNQRTDGNFLGSWDPVDAWGHEGGRVYATALLVMSLAAPTRFANWK